MNHWYAFRVPSQRELTAESFLVEKRGFDKDSIFVCHVKRLLKRRSKKEEDRWSKRSLCNGYIFIKTDAPFEIVRRFGIIWDVLKSDGIARPISDDAMKNLQERSGQIASSRTPSSIKVWVEGESVKISEGPFVGMTGKIEKAKGERARVKLSKPLLGKETVELKSGSLEAA